MVRAISVYSVGVPYAARFTAAVKIKESYLKAISSDYGLQKKRFHLRGHVQTIYGNIKH